MQSEHGKTCWYPALSNEWGRLAKGNDNGVAFTNTIEFISKNGVPTNKKVTYASFACDYRPLKDEKWRVCIVVGGDKLTYAFDTGSPAADIVETKLLFNSVISDAKSGAKFCSMDLKDMFLHTPMTDPEFMKVLYKYFPHDIRKRYNLDSLVTTDNFIYIKLIRGMYGLKQAALLAYNILSNLLKNEGNFPIVSTSGLWKHTTRKTLFCLCVDDFRVKYYNEDDLNHLRKTSEQQYTCKIDWSGQNFLGFTLDWNYSDGYVDISMPGYVDNALKKLQYKQRIYPQHSPHQYFEKKWTTKGQQQSARTIDTSPLLSPKDTTYIQTVVGTFLYYAQALDNTMLPALNDIATQQAQPTQKVKQKVQQLLDYANTYKNVFVRFFASDMQLQINSDAAFLVLPKARSCIAGYFCLLDRPKNR